MSKLNAFLASVPANGLDTPIKNAPTTSPWSKESTSMDHFHADDDEEDEDEQQQQQAAEEVIVKKESLSSSFTDSKKPTPFSTFLTSTRKDQHSSSSSLPRPFSSRNNNQEEEEEEEEHEAYAMKRHTLGGGGQQQQHRSTMLFKSFCRKKANEDIDEETIEYFKSLQIPTTSRSSGIPTSMDPMEILIKFQNGQLLSIENALQIISKATELFTSQLNILQLTAEPKMIICGDLHGQFQDLIDIFQHYGYPSTSNRNQFLFLGDYVDRGICSCEIILFLLAFKIQFPHRVHLLRGNHECRSLSTFYGFRQECLNKYGPIVYNRLMNCFQTLSLGAILQVEEGKFFCVHGGLSPEIETLQDIEKLNRFQEPEPTGALCDLLWSDPSKDLENTNEWSYNSVRGCSYIFNEQVCRAFLQKNQLLAIIRAHELEEEGFHQHFQTKNDPYPLVMTVFSAPKYCNTHENRGATLEIPYKNVPNVQDKLIVQQYVKTKQEMDLTFGGKKNEKKSFDEFIQDQVGHFISMDFYDLVSVCRSMKNNQTPHNQSIMSDFSFSDIEEQEEQEEELKIDILRPVSVEPPVLLSTGALVEPKPIQDMTTECRNRPLSISILSVSVKEDEIVAARAVSPLTGTSSRDNKKNKKKKSFCPSLRELLFGSKKKKTSTKKKPKRSSWLCLYGRQKHQEYRGSDERDEEDDDEEEDHLAILEEICIDKGPLHVSAPSTPNAMATTTPTLVHMSSSSNTTTTTTTTVSTILPFKAKTTIKKQKKGKEIFTLDQWKALKLIFELLDVNGNGLVLEESFSTLLIEQDPDGYATKEELGLLMELMDVDGDGVVSQEDFVLFAYRTFLFKKPLTTSK